MPGQWALHKASAAILQKSIDDVH